MSCEITFTAAAKVISFGLNFCLGDEKEAAAFSVKSDISGAWIVAISEHFLTHVLALCGQDMEQQSLMLCDKPFELAQKSRVHEFPLSLGEET